MSAIPMLARFACTLMHCQSTWTKSRVCKCLKGRAVLCFVVLPGLPMLFDSQSMPPVCLLWMDASAQYMFTTQKAILWQSCLSCSSESVARSLMFCLTLAYAHVCLDQQLPWQLSGLSSPLALGRCVQALALSYSLLSTCMWNGGRSGRGGRTWPPETPRARESPIMVLAQRSRASVSSRLSTRRFFLARDSASEHFSSAVYSSISRTVSSASSVSNCSTYPAQQHHPLRVYDRGQPCSEPLVQGRWAHTAHLLVQGLCQRALEQCRAQQHLWHFVSCASSVIKLLHIPCSPSSKWILTASRAAACYLLNLGTWQARNAPSDVLLMLAMQQVHKVCIATLLVMAQSHVTG